MELLPFWVQQGQQRINFGWSYKQNFTVFKLMFAIKAKYFSIENKDPMGT